MLDPLLGDLEELDAVNRELGTLQLLHDVPRYGLAFAIGVGCEQDGVGVLGGALELGENFDLAFDDLVRLGEVVLDVDPHLLGEVFDMPLGGHDLIAGPQVFFDGLRLRRRLHHHECLHSHWTLVP